jgi:phosphoribosylpyrophosphate synthetase
VRRGACWPSARRIVADPSLLQLHAVQTAEEVTGRVIGLFTGPAIERLKQEPDLGEIVMTNTVPLAADKQLPTMVTRSVAPLFAEAVKRIHLGESISSLFSDVETYG